MRHAVEQWLCASLYPTFSRLLALMGPVLLPTWRAGVHLSLHLQSRRCCPNLMVFDFNCNCSLTLKVQTAARSSAAL